MSKPKKNQRRYLIIVLVALVALLIGAAVIQQKRKPSGEQVETAKIETREIKEMVSASGKVFPEKEVKISSDVSGEIVELLVEEGDSVQTGQLLAKIDPDAYVSAVERGKATLNNSKAQLAISRSQEESNRAQYEQIVAQLKNTRKIHERNVQLKKQGIISDADFEASLSNLEIQEANLKASMATIRSAEQSSKAAEFSVKGAAATLKEMQTSLSRTSIYSPSAGIVSKLDVEQGERVVGTIQMAGTEMMRVANLNNMEVQVEVSENDILKVNLGDEVEIEVDAYLDKIFMGTVTEIANSAVEEGGIQSLTSERVTNFVVKIRIDPTSYKDVLKESEGYAFRPGMSASVNINTQTQENVLTVPIQAVTTRDPNEDEKNKDKDKEAEGEEEKEKDFDDLIEVVFVLSADTVKMIEVVTGIQDDEYIHVIEGLSEGEEVVTGPYRVISKKLKAGMKVRKKEEKEKDESEDT